MVLYCFQSLIIWHEVSYYILKKCVIMSIEEIIRSACGFELSALVVYRECGLRNIGIFAYSCLLAKPSSIV